MSRTDKFDASEHLKTDEDMAAYLDACIEESGNDSDFVAKALGDIAKAKGLSELKNKEIERWWKNKGEDISREDALAFLEKISDNE